MKLPSRSKANERGKGKVLWIKQEQGKVETRDNFENEQGQLNLQKNGTKFFK